MLSLSSRAKALFLALSIFILGALCGAMGERWFIRSQFHPFARMGEGPPGMDRPDRGGRGDRGPGPSIRRMARDLNLTQEQQATISKITEEFRNRIDIVRQEISEKMQTGGEEIRAKIRAELTEEQRVKFDQMEKDREQRWRGGSGGRGGRGGWGGGPPKGPGP
ncbi:MAG: Spy/CpxP family protein refolding chaperone [Candidatus Latescibacterota bacterium]|jgi:Spy/CpxP family protein refolding chaperone